MNKKILLFISILGISVITAGCNANKGNSGIQPQQNTASQTKSSDGTTTENISSDAALSEEEVKTIALEDAGVSENDVSHIRVKLEKDDGILEYEVEFYAGSQEYDYSILASTGEIVSKDMEIENDFYTENTQAENNSQNSSAAVSEEEAKKTALAKVNGATEQNIRIHADWDDGRQIYEGSIYHGDREYEFEIDASTGEIISWEEESIYD